MPKAFLNHFKSIFQLLFIFSTILQCIMLYCSYSTQSYTHINARYRLDAPARTNPLCMLWRLVVMRLCSTTLFISASSFNMFSFLCSPSSSLHQTWNTGVSYQDGRFLNGRPIILTITKSNISSKTLQSKMHLPTLLKRFIQPSMTNTTWYVTAKYFFDLANTV